MNWSGMIPESLIEARCWTLRLWKKWKKNLEDIMMWMVMVFVTELIQELIQAKGHILQEELPMMSTLDILRMVK